MSIAVSNVTTAGNVVYTSSGNTAITFLSVCNYGNVNTSFNFYVVPSGGTAGNTNIVFGNIVLQAGNTNSGDTFQIYSAAEKILLGNGDFIKITSNANTVTAVVSYTSI